MKDSLLSNSVIWAVDPLIKSAKNLMVVKAALQTWQRQDPIKIKPLSVITSQELRLPLSLMAPWGEKLQALTENAVKPFLKSLHIKNLAEPGVVMVSSKSDSIVEFLTYARKSKARMILTLTHERSGFDRNRIGKFTQKLIEKSSIPVLTIRPSTEIPKKISRILYPTDFSKASKASYLKAIGIAQKLNSSIVIFHNIYDPVLPAAELTGVPINQFEVLKAYSQEYARKQKSDSEKWIRLAQEKGVKAEFHGERADFSLSKSILKAAQKQNAHLIILGIESHPLMRAVLKSSTREIISVSKRPVMVIKN